jgi:hypothetical protein
MLQLQLLGFKCIVFDEQLRIIPGGFDLATSVIYSHLTPVDASAYNDHPMAPYMEDFAQNYSKSLGQTIAPSPNGNLLPIVLKQRELSVKWTLLLSPGGIRRLLIWL